MSLYAPRLQNVREALETRRRRRRCWNVAARDRLLFAQSSDGHRSLNIALLHGGDGEQEKTDRSQRGLRARAGVKTTFQRTASDLCIHLR